MEELRQYVAIGLELSMPPRICHRGNPEAILADWERKLKAAATRRKEVNTILTKTLAGVDILAGWICPKTTEALRKGSHHDQKI